MVSLEVKKQFKISVEELYAVIADIEKYCEFVDGVKGVKVLEKADDYILAEFNISWVKKVKYNIKMVFEKNKKISWSLTDPTKVIKANSGCWKFISHGESTEIIYNVDLDFIGVVPEMFVNKIEVNNLPKMLIQFYERAISLRE